MSQLSHDRLPFRQKFALHQWFAPAVRTFSSHFTGSPFRSSQITKPAQLYIIANSARMDLYTLIHGKSKTSRFHAAQTQRSQFRLIYNTPRIWVTLITKLDQIGDTQYQIGAIL